VVRGSVQLIEVCGSRASNARSRRAQAVVERALLQTGVELSRVGSDVGRDTLWTSRRGGDDHDRRTVKARVPARERNASGEVRAKAREVDCGRSAKPGWLRSCRPERTGAARPEVGVIAETSSTCSHAARRKSGGPRSVRPGERTGLTAWRIIRPCGHRGQRVRSMPVSRSSWACQPSAPTPLGTA
jgi:hypothetical protein